MKKLVISSIILVSLLATVLFSGYVNIDPQYNPIVPEEYTNNNPDVSETDDVDQEQDKDIQENSQASSESELSGDPIRVGAFNVQVFGTTKASKPEVMEVLADIIRTYDIVAIQEIRDSSETALPFLVDLVNSDGSQYSYVVSERLGRTTSKEQYAYIYDTDTIEMTGTAHTYPEPEGTDPFHRQPYITSFKTIGGNYDAVLMVIHTDPDEATEEINALAEVVEYARNAYPGEQDFILMGDFNADGSYFDEDSTSDISGDEFTWVIDNSQDTTVASSSNTYDRIVLTDTYDYIDSAVFRFDNEYGLNSTETAAVSDHYPVYVEFDITRDNDKESISTVPDAATESAYAPSEEVDESTNSSEFIKIAGISLSDEWVSIQNIGSSPVSLEGWTITDDGNMHTYTFSSFTLSAGATVTLHSGSGNDNATDLYWGSSRSVWNNDGDIARLYDVSGNLVDTSE